MSVAVSFQLTDTTDGSTFTGGETTDHVVTTSEVSGQPVTILDDQNTGVSTAPARLVAETAADAAAVRRVDKKVPSWQLKGKQVNKKAKARQGGGKTTAAQAPYPMLNYQAMANYASLWSDAAHANQMNSTYGSAGDDCTNFISQALHAGGWPIRDTTYINRKNLDYWDYNMTGPGTFTYSWSRAEENYRMVHDKAGKTPFGDMEDAALADLVYFDWNVGPAIYGDGLKDHVMIVTKRTTTHPYFSQKSGNRHNVPPSQVVQNIKDGGGTQWKVLGLRT